MLLNLTKKILNFKDKNPNLNLTLSGIDPQKWFFLHHFFIKDSLPNQSHQVFVFPSEEEAESFYSTIKNYTPSLFYPDIGNGVYSGTLTSERMLNERMLCLSKLSGAQTYTVCTTLKALSLKVPKLSLIKNLAFNISISDILSTNELANKLRILGYEQSATIEEPGTFAQKGEIFDIYPIGEPPVRIHYFDDMIEEIFEVSCENLRTLRDKPIESFKVSPSCAFVIRQKNAANTLRLNLPHVPFNHREQRRAREEAIDRVTKGMLFPNFPLYFSLFFDDTTSLKNELQDTAIFHLVNLEDSSKELTLTMEEMSQAFENATSNPEFDDLLPHPESIYTNDTNFSHSDAFLIDQVHIHDDELNDRFEHVNMGIEPIKNYAHKKNDLLISLDKSAYLRSLLAIIVNPAHQVLIAVKNNFSITRIKDLLLHLDPNLSTRDIKFVDFNLGQGFHYKLENLFIISESDFFPQKISKTKRRREFSEDVFAEQISSLQEGDYVIHKEHGIGKYLGMETITLASQTSDFLVLQYANHDKVYVPVYKLNLIQKHSNAQASVTLANLKTRKFDLEKKRVSKSVKKLAFDLLEIQAKRELKQGYAFSQPDELYRDFESKFPFQETEDQIKAIDDVISDMTSSKPMDRLICGDVGFGKTEIAMRAAFKAVLDHKQVAILVPTTVLAFQHYNSFVQRFKEFAVNIDFVSRFKSAKEFTEISHKIKHGDVDIIIGTHKILSDKVKFHDLGLLIIDEEQRFGVAHKEKMKSLKENIDCLTMTATPIPRTLQLSFLGIKDFSIIKTPPPKRQSIKTHVVKEDFNTIRKAIDKELNRGGQVFIVHNKVHDIEEYSSKIKKLCPNANLVFAHGQLPEKELEKRITQFYQQKFDILVSTTIIESGIDIPSANTMIIDRADTYGLSQLHQLRGRIGRSDKKAYAYFVIPSTRSLSQVAAKRLRALQTYADMGAGFSLATSDLEIRGSGDILGAEQSGHIANIGLELYMELLKEEIAHQKNEPILKKQSVEIQTPFQSFIPENYIEDTGTRLKYYKKLSNADSVETLNSLEEELNDIYGLVPSPLSNLLHILHARIYLAAIFITSAKVLSKSILITFDKSSLEQNAPLRDQIIGFFIERPKKYKFNPDFSVNCKFEQISSPETLLQFAKDIAQQIEPC